MMDKELIEMAKLAEMSILDEGLGAYTIYGNLDCFKEFHRLATEKSVRDALEKAVKICEKHGHYIMGGFSCLKAAMEIRALIEPVAGEKS